MNMDNIQERLAIARAKGWNVSLDTNLASNPRYTVRVFGKGKETVKVQHNNQNQAIANALNIIEGVE